MNGWETFFAAEVGASAALTGLLFVAVSISLSKIVASPHLPNRALQALIVLLQILVISSLMLVPQSLFLIGIETVTIGLAIWIVDAIFDFRSLRAAATTSYRSRTVYRAIVSELAALLYVVAGAIILGAGSTGLYWLVPAMLGAFLVAILDAWVLLIEINR